MKYIKTVAIAFIFALVFTACRKPEINSVLNGSEMADTLVKKYLVKEYYAEIPERPIRFIEWNDDFTQIRHITTDSSALYQVDYDFEYYGSDSMQVILSLPAYSSALVLFSEYTCHFDEAGRISYIDYFNNSVYKQTEKYNYDSSGKLVSVVDEEHNVGARFVWDGDNVREICGLATGEQLRSFDGFFQHIHPYYTFPYLLPDGNTYNFWYLTEPLWKNWYNYTSDMYYEVDEDGYVTCSYRIDELGEKTAITNYEYVKYPNYKL